MEIQHGKGPWAPPVSGIVPLGSTLTLVVAINDYRGNGGGGNDFARSRNESRTRVFNSWILFSFLFRRSIRRIRHASEVLRGLGRRRAHDTAERRVRMRAEAEDDQPILEGEGLRRSRNGHHLRLLSRVQVPGRVKRAHQVQGKRCWI